MIRKRLLTWFVLVALGPVIGVGIATSLVSYYSGRQQSIDRLEAVAARKELAIQGWVEALQHELLFISHADSSPKFVTTALRLSNEGKSYSWYVRLARKQLVAFVRQSPQMTELLLLDREGRVAVSTVAEREGEVYRDQPFFQQALAGPVTRLPFHAPMPQPAGGPIPLHDETAVLSAVPVIGDQAQVLGVMVGLADIGALHAILDERTGLAETGRAYLADASYALLAGTHLAAQAQGSDAIVRTAGIEAALRQASSGPHIYAGPGGTRVIGVCRWLPEVGAVLSVEQDLTEALRSILATTGINIIIGLAAVVVAVIAGLSVTRSIADPIIELASTASQIARGDLTRTAEVARDDEVGALARAFNSMTAQLRDLISSLERRVDERTRALQEANEALERRAVQLQTSAEVGRQITSILDVDVLLSRVAELTRDAFGYYHVQIFLLDKESHRLLLRASSGDRSAEHRYLDTGRASVNAAAAQTGQPLLVNDVSHDARFLPDSQLPETRSELAVPLRLGEQVIGTLDVHHASVGAFSEEDVLVIQGLADQLAVAIENAHLYDQSRSLAILEERSRLARELHDSVTQSLYSLVLLAEGWRRLLSPNDGPQVIEEHLGRIGEIAQQALREMRLLIHELRPPALEQEGLVGALRKRLDAVERRVGIDGRVVMEQFIELPATVEEGLYRIAQEALNNALKHAAATRETVRISMAGETLVLEISDDGQGFDPESAEPKGGMGLAGMRERARAMGGTFSILSSRGAGTTVRVEVPVPCAGWR